MKIHNDELNIKKSKELLNDSIIFNIFVMLLEKMHKHNFNFGFTKMKKKKDINFYIKYIIEKFNNNIDIYYNQIKNIRNKIYFHYEIKSLETITSLSLRNKDDTDIVNSENLNLSRTSSNFEPTYNIDDKYIKNLNDNNLDFFETKKKNNEYQNYYRNKTITDFVNNNEEMIFETN